jgi:hypothetical protein
MKFLKTIIKAVLEGRNAYVTSKMKKIDIII